MQRDVVSLSSFFSARSFLQVTNRIFYWNSYRSMDGTFVPCKWTISIVRSLYWNTVTIYLRGLCPCINIMISVTVLRISKPLCGSSKVLLGS